MAFRTFVDSGGAEWQVFTVVPRTEEERRQYDRRSGQFDAIKDDDRRFTDRRLTVGGKTAIIGSSTDGWLCFQRADDDSERRRLSPIPDDWTKVDEATLESWCGEARRAPLERTSS